MAERKKTVVETESCTPTAQSHIDTKRRCKLCPINTVDLDPVSARSLAQSLFAFPWSLSAMDRPGNPSGLAPRLLLVAAAERASHV